MAHSHQNKNFPPQDHEEQNKQNNQISISKKLCIDTDVHLTHVSDIFKERLMKENIEKALLKTFERKKIVDEGEFQVQQAIDKGIKISNNYLDKLERWLRDSIFYPKNLQSFWKFKEEKERRVTEKISSIQFYSSKLSEKMMHKTLEREKKIYVEELEKRKISLPHSRQLQIASDRVDEIEGRLSKILEQWK